MTDTYSIKDVTRDLGFLLTLTKLFEMDEKGFWYDPGQEKRYVHKLDANDDGKEIAVFQDPLPKGDFYFFNPFAEGFGKKSPAVQLFYKTIRIAFNLNLRNAVLYVAKEILSSKETEGKSLGHAIVRMSSVPVDKKTTVFDVIDEKMVEEFEKLFDRANDDIVFVPYMSQQMSAKVKVDVLTDDKWDEKFGKDIRKKALGAFRALVMGVLGIKDVSELETFTVKYDPDLKSSAKMHTTITVYLKLYTRFNDILADAFGVDGVPSERDEIDLGTLQEVIDRFPLAYAIAKHMVQPSLPKHTATDTTAVDTSKLSFANQQGGRRFPGPEMVDEMGRRVRPGSQQPTLQIGRPADTHHGRFAPHVIGEAKADPFAPAVRPANAGVGLAGGGFSGPVSFSNTQSQGGYFGSQPSMGGFSAGLDLNPPSNFGSPGVSRGYFG